MSSFQDFVNTELPRRRPLLTPSIASGYDGDPNNAGAPAIIQGAPAGSWYFEESQDRFWRRDTTNWKLEGTGSGGGSVSGLPTNTEELVLNVDPNDPSSVNVPAGTVFTTQQEIDDFLAANGATAVKFYQNAIDSMPSVVSANIRVILAAGVHPDQGDPEVEAERFAATSYALILESRVFFNSATLSIEGAGQADWDVVDPSYANLVPDSVTGFAGGRLNEFATTSPTLFDDGPDPVGYWLRDNSRTSGDARVTYGIAQVVSGSSIASIDDQQNPTDVSVVQPSTILNTVQAGAGFVLQRASLTGYEISGINFRRPSGNFFAALVLFSGNANYSDCLFDTQNSNGADGLFTFDATTPDAQAFVSACNFINSGGNDRPFFADALTKVQFRLCVFRDFGNGARAIATPAVELANTQFVRCGSASGSAAERAALQLFQSSAIFFDFAALRIGFIDCPGPGVFLQDSGVSAESEQIRFVNLTQPLWVIGSGCMADLFRGWDAFLVENCSDVGVAFDGLNSVVEFGAVAQQLTGTAGDVRMADGDILTWQQIVDSGPYADAQGNRIREVT